MTNPLSNSKPWNEVATGYADLADWVMAPFSHKAISLSHPQSHSLVVDVACGTGVLSYNLASQVKAITALDFSPQMIEELQRKIHEKKITNIKTLVGDGLALPLKDNTFDLAYSLFGLMFFPERLKGFIELHRVLKPGGQAIVSSWASIEKSSLMQLTSEAIQAIIPSSSSPRANSATLENPEVFKSEMQEAGFHSIEIHECRLNLPPIQPKLFWKLMSEGGAPMTLLKASYSESEWSHLSAQISQYIERKSGGNPLELMTTSYIGTGVKK